MASVEENINIAPKDLCHSFVNIIGSIFEEYPDGFIYKDNNLKYLTVNKALLELLEINKNDILNQKDISFLSKENKQLIQEVSKSVQITLEPINYVINLQTKRGIEKVFNITTTPIVKNNKTFGIISVLKDITYEESIKENFVLKHFQLKALFENLPMLIYMQDLKGNYLTGTEFSKKFAEQGYDTFSNLYLNIDDIKNENKLIIKEQKTTNKEWKIFDINNTPHWYKICKVPILDEKGELSGILTIADNIDGQKLLEIQRETFVATLGHDLKNPVIAQIRSLELLLKGGFGNLKKEQQEILEMVLDSCKYMNGMLACLLATYRNNGGIIKLQFDEFMPEELINECVTEMAYVAKDKDIKISINSDLNKSNINADRIQLKRVIMNLLSNGIKYAYKNTFVELRLHISNDYLNFELQNESPYIPKEKQDAIFGQYVSFASTLNELGNGLGLYASEKIINSHDGEIFVKSYKDNRNIFGFKIPIKPNKNNLNKDIKF